MQKAFIILSAFFCAQMAQAQLNVDSNGNVGIARSEPFAYAKLAIGDKEDTEYSLFDFNIFSRSDAPSSYYNIGIGSDVYPYPVSGVGRAIGVRGIAGSTESGYNYGILGSVQGSQNGAGIFGTVTNVYGLCIPGRYAGYFDGNTHVTGIMTSPSFVVPSDISQEENIVSLRSSGRGSAIDRIMNLDVIVYNYKEPQYADADTLSEALLKARKEARKLDQKTHFGLSVQELQQIYPELVVEGADGLLGINYVELVPVLIQSIQELRHEVEELRGNADETQKARSAINEDEATGLSHPSKRPVDASLEQNSPNPFSERTEIRFSLPDDAQDAQVCIFDMSGKMLRQLPVNPNMRSVTINGYELSAGMYLYSLLADGNVIDTKRMILTK